MSFLYLNKTIQNYNNINSDESTLEPYTNPIKNEVILFLIEKGIVKTQHLYSFSNCREFTYANDESNKNVVFCKHSNIKFINESLAENNENVYKDLDVYQYFQAENNDMTTVLNREMNFQDDNNRRFQNIKDLVSGKVYLDFACGYGGMLNMCNRYASQTIGVEIMQTAIKYLRDNGQCIYSDILEVPDSFVDVISIYQSFELLHEPIRYLKRFYSKLKVDGYFILETSNANKALYRLYNCYGYKNFITQLRKVIYTEDALRAILKHVGFRNISIDYHQRYNLSNHLGWISTNMPGNDIKMFDNYSELSDMYKKVLVKEGVADTLFVICQK